MPYKLSFKRFREDVEPEKTNPISRETNDFYDLGVELDLDDSAGARLRGMEEPEFANAVNAIGEKNSGSFQATRNGAGM